MSPRRGLDIDPVKIPNREPWMVDGACVEVGAGFTELTTAEQKQVCRHCAVTEECLEFAIAKLNHSRNHDGGAMIDPRLVFGGLGFGERRAILKERKNQHGAR